MSVVDDIVAAREQAMNAPYPAPRFIWWGDAFMCAPVQLAPPDVQAEFVRQKQQRPGKPVSIAREQ